MTSRKSPQMHLETTHRKPCASGPTNGFSKAAPSSVQLASDLDLLRMLHVCAPAKADEKYPRYIAAKETLETNHCAQIGLLREESGALSAFIRLEIPTTDTTLDRNLSTVVTHAGFLLTFSKTPCRKGNRFVYESKPYTAAVFKVSGRQTAVESTACSVKTDNSYVITADPHKRTSDPEFLCETAEALVKLVGLLRMKAS